MGNSVSVGIRDPLTAPAATARAWLGLRRCTWVWLMLVGLTAVSFGIGVLGRGGVGFMVLLVIIVILKGHLISDFFMGLRRANTLWRALILVYLVIIGGGIAAGYLIGMS